MKFFDRFRNVATSARFKMVTERGNGFYEWNGVLFESDIVRACIRPRAKAIGKLVGKHIRKTVKNGATEIVTNPDAYMKFLLEEPNPYMSGQVMQEKIANQLSLNNNAFILIMRDANGIPVELYPIPATGVEAIYNASGDLSLKFYFINGKWMTVPYTEVIHLRDDFYSNDIFGDSPAVALTSLMNVVGTIDKGIIQAIRNSGIVRWLLKFTTPLRPEDLKKNVQDFVDNYLSAETTTFGAAGMDSKADVIRIEPKDYVPNAALTDKTRERILSFFNTNDKIVRSEYTEDEWNSYFEARIEPDSVQMGLEYTRKLFTRTQRGFGNKIVFEASNLQCASISTKLALVAMVDRGALLPNEWRETMNLSPIAGGDEPIRRLDTQVVNQLVKKIDGENYKELSNLILVMLSAGKDNDHEKDRNKG